MNIISYNARQLVPWSDFDHMFNGLYFETNSENTWSATVNIQEDDKAIVLTADLPDVADEDLDVKVEKGALTLRAKRQPEKESQEIEARYDKGVLWVTLPKRPEKKNRSRQIRIH